MEANYAVVVENATKFYGNQKVLDNLSMRVNKGTIYGLLGASGCGKTTLLHAILNRIELDAGGIIHFGESGGRISANRMGFMPQNLALVGELTVKDTILYFGRLMNMSEKLIEERFQELSTLLELPKSSTRLSECSGGQQRRVSFAAALVHKPELLILDEPTAGVDPLIRERIWNHLLKMTLEHGTTVIITTHYIEEAKFANRVGLMRKGKLLAENSPSKLLEEHQTEILEEAFLALINKHSENIVNTTSVHPTNSKKQSVGNTMSHFRLSKHRFQALLSKNWKQFYRNKTGVVFQLLFPLLELFIFLIAIGGDPKGVRLAIVNDECAATSQRNDSLIICDIGLLSNRFLTYIGDALVIQVPYDSLEIAEKDAKDGEVIGVLHFPKNFTDSYFRLLNISTVDEEKHSFSSNSQINVQIDMSNPQIGGIIKRKLLQRYINFEHDICIEHGLENKRDSLNFQFIYGSLDEPYTTYVLPAALVTIMYFMGTIITTIVILQERLEGIWDRSIVAGVSSFEITLSHFALQATVCLIQASEIVAFMRIYVSYGTNIWFQIWFILYLQSIAGMSFGFLISAISSDYGMASNATSGSFMIMSILSGFIWPIEGMPEALRIVAKFLPFTEPIESLRNVMTKDFCINNYRVWQGLLVSFSWTVVYILCSFYFIIKRRRPI